MKLHSAERPGRIWTQDLIFSLQAKRRRGDTRRPRLGGAAVWTNVVKKFNHAYSTCVRQAVIASDTNTAQAASIATVAFLRRKARAPSMPMHKRCSSIENLSMMPYTKPPRLTKLSASFNELLTGIPGFR
jgi:hypothetical protein